MFATQVMICTTAVTLIDLHWYSLNGAFRVHTHRHTHLSLNVTTMCVNVFLCLFLPQLRPSVPPLSTSTLRDNVTGCQSRQGLGCIGDERVFGRTLLWATPGRRQQREAWYRRNQPYHSQVSHSPSSSIFSLWPLNSSNHACGVNSDPWNRDPCGCHMQAKCTAIPKETL